MLPACRALRLTSTSMIHPAPFFLQSFSTTRRASPQSPGPRGFSTTSVKPTKTVLVTSATGRIGKEVVARLAKTPGFRVKAAVFTPSKADYLSNLGADEVVHFDLQNAETWGEALKEVRVCEDKAKFYNKNHCFVFVIKSNSSLRFAPRLAGRLRILRFPRPVAC